jgi:hypothetical protein
MEHLIRGWIPPSIRGNDEGEIKLSYVKTLKISERLRLAVLELEVPKFSSSRPSLEKGEAGCQTSFRSTRTLACFVALEACTRNEEQPAIRKPRVEGVKNLLLVTECQQPKMYRQRRGDGWQQRDEDFCSVVLGRWYSCADIRVYVMKRDHNATLS